MDFRKKGLELLNRYRLTGNNTSEKYQLATQLVTAFLSRDQFQTLPIYKFILQYSLRRGPIHQHLGFLLSDIGLLEKPLLRQTFRAGSPIFAAKYDLSLGHVFLVPVEDDQYPDQVVIYCRPCRVLRHPIQIHPSQEIIPGVATQVFSTSDNIVPYLLDWALINLAVLENQKSL